MQQTGNLDKQTRAALTAERLKAPVFFGQVKKSWFVSFSWAKLRRQLSADSVVSHEMKSSPESK